MEKCPKCGMIGDVEYIDEEFIFQRCGHAFTLTYIGYYLEGGCILQKGDYQW